MNIKKYQQRLANWSARGDKCPICKREFRSNTCPHSVEQAQQKLAEELLSAQIANLIKKNSC